MNHITVGIAGLGVVGCALQNVFTEKKIMVKGYDKYKKIGSPEDLLEVDIAFLALPTPYSKDLNAYDKSALEEVLSFLYEKRFKGLVVIKSTVEPGATQKFSNIYNVRIVHNPEFLTARTAEADFRDQEHIVIGGKTLENDDVRLLRQFYQHFWPNAKISVCTYEESECMKISVNAFYAVKIQFFNEIYDLCQQHAPYLSYDRVLQMMLANGWISPHHTQCPGHDGQLSYGGMCFPKDTNALLQEMIRRGSHHKVLQATIEERDEMRKNVED
jgi:UDPglucose 6-dehydrogenase